MAVYLIVIGMIQQTLEIVCRIWPWISLICLWGWHWNLYGKWKLKVLKVRILQCQRIFEVRVNICKKQGISPLGLASQVTDHPDSFVGKAVMNVHMLAGIKSCLCPLTLDIVVGEVGWHSTIAWAATNTGCTAVFQLLANNISLEKMQNSTGVIQNIPFDAIISIYN